MLTKIFDQNPQNPQMTGSFHPTPTKYAMLSTVIENEFSEATSSKERTNAATENDGENLNKEPMKDQIASISSTNDLDPFPLDVTVKIDHIEVNKSIDDDKLIEDFINPIDESIPSEVNDKSSEDEDDIMTDMTSLYTIQPRTPERASIPIFEAINDEIGDDIYTTPRSEPLPEADSSVDVVLKKNVVMKTPPFRKYFNDQEVRTPIGKLVIRKVTHSTQFDHTQYAVEIVQKFQRPLAQTMHHPMYPPSYSDDRALAKTPTVKTPIASYPSRRSAKAASKPSPIARVISRRVSTLEEHQRHYGTSERVTRKSIRKSTRINPVHAKGILEPLRNCRGVVN